MVKDKTEINTEAEKTVNSDDSMYQLLPKTKSEESEKYTLSFAEFQDKSTNVTCLVVRKDSTFTVINDGSLNGNKDQIMATGVLRIHQHTGKIILTKSKNDIYAPEIGGCSDGPIVIDLKNKIVEFC